MEFEDIIKIVGVVAFFIVSSMFDSKKKKKKKQASQPTESYSHETTEYSQKQQTQPTVQSTNDDDFFAEVRKMLDENENDTLKKDAAYEESYQPKVEQKKEPFLDSVSKNYFEQEYIQEEIEHFPTDMPMPKEEGEPQTDRIEAHTPMQSNKKKTKSKINLKQAIKHQIILERKYT